MILSPSEGKPVLRWSAPIGTSSKFEMPGVGAARLYVGNREGKVMAFGSPVTAPLTGASTSFPTTTIGSTSEKTLTLTATSALTITTLSSTSTQFLVGAPSIPLPAKLSAGQTIQIPLTFAPSQNGLQGATLNAETTAGTVGFALAGTGQTATALLSASPTLVSFGGTEVGGRLASAATFRNLGAAPLTINAIKLPTAPFAATGVPAVGSTIAPGGSVTVNLTFEPTAEGNFSGEIGMETTGGNVSVGLVGSAGTPGTLKITGETNEFGNVAVGSTATRSFTVTNTGGTAVAITKSKPPSGGAFAATTSLAEGTTIAPGETLTETVAFTPTAPGYASATWALNGDDTSGLHELKFSGTGTVPAPGGAWSHNGTATITSGVLQTTPIAQNSAGASFFTTPLESRHLVVQFDQTIGGGNVGADGQTLTFADASKATPASLGVSGGGLGFSGIPGIAVAFDTYKNSANPSNNFVGITNGPGSASDLLHWLSTSTSIPALRTATRHVKIEALNGTITVWVEGTQVLSTAVTLPPEVLIGFTGGSGYYTDLHKVANVLISGEPPPGEPKPASLKLSAVVDAPSGSSQASTKLAVSGSCPSAFTTEALGNGESATPTLTGAVAGSSCAVSEAAPSGSGWKTTASVNGGAAIALTSSGGQLAVPSFALAAGVNTVQLTNTYTEPQPASLKLTTVVNAPSGSSQAATKLALSGSCPSSFTTAALGNGESATPTLTGAVAGSSCAVSEAAPSGSGWKTTASVNGGAAIALTPSGGQLTVPSFALVAGVNTVQLTNTYTETGSLIPDPSAGGWQLNGSATLEAPNLVLTGAVSNEAGSAFWPEQLNPQNLIFEFELSIGGGTGADGLALVFADASKGATPTSLGEPGGGLGFGGIAGVAQAFDTYKNSANPSSNFVGISNGKGSGAGLLHWIGTANVSAPLRNTVHKIKLSTASGAIALWIDGTKIGSLAVTLPTDAYVGFSAGTGSVNDRHAISHLVVTPSG